MMSLVTTLFLSAGTAWVMMKMLIVLITIQGAPKAIIRLPPPVPLPVIEEAIDVPTCAACTYWPR